MDLDCKVSFFSMDLQVAFSSDAKFCAIAGGRDCESWHLIEIPYQLQYKMTSSHLENSFAPCFLDEQRVFIGGKSRFEIWSLEHLNAVKVVKSLPGDKWINCACSREQMLVVGSSDNSVMVFDTRNFDMIHSINYIMIPQSVHLTPDLKYLTVSGESGERCVVSEIK